MVELYFVIFAIIALLTFPMALRPVAYGYDAEDGLKYDSLWSLNKGMHWGVYLIFFLFGVLLVMECVNRSELIADYMMYRHYYEQGGGSGNRRGIELTFNWLVRISPDFLVLLAYYAIIAVSIHLLAIVRNSPNIWLSMLLYVGFYFVLHEMIQMRAAVAVGILLLSVRFITYRQWYIYFPLAACAIMFHYSAIVMVPLYFVPAKRLNKTFWVVFLLVALVLGLMGTGIGILSRYIPLEIINGYLRSYLGNREFVASEIGPVRVFKCVALMIMILNIDKIKERYPLVVTCLCVSVISQVCYLLMSDIPVMQTRLGEFFGSVDIFTFAAFPLISKRYYYALMIVPIALIVNQLQLTISLLTTVV